MHSVCLTYDIREQLLGELSADYSYHLSFFVGLIMLLCSKEQVLQDESILSGIFHNLRA